MTGNIKGAAIMVATMAAFSLNDACMKGLSSYLPFHQAVFLRSLLATVLLVIICIATKQLTFRVAPADRRWLAFRTLAEIWTSGCFLFALFNMPISNATAILQVSSLSVALAAAMFLGEKLGRTQLIAIALGFFGVLLILRPGGEGFNIYGLCALGAVLGITARDIASRKMSSAVPSIMAALAASVGITACFAVSSSFVEWAPVSQPAALLLIGSAVFILTAFTLAVWVMRFGDVATVAPFRYTSLVVAMLTGVIIFGERPDALTLVGAAIIIGAGLLALRAELRLKR